jgi:hypothetical protein
MKTILEWIVVVEFDCGLTCWMRIEVSQEKRVVHLFVWHQNKKRSIGVLYKGSKLSEILKLLIVVFRVE